MTKTRANRQTSVEAVHETYLNKVFGPTSIRSFSTHHHHLAVVNDQMGGLVSSRIPNINRGSRTLGVANPQNTLTHLHRVRSNQGRGWLLLTVNTVQQTSWI